MYIYYLLGFVLYYLFFVDRFGFYNSQQNKFVLYDVIIKSKVKYCNAVFHNNLNFVTIYTILHFRIYTSMLGDHYNGNPYLVAIR